MSDVTMSHLHIDTGPVYADLDAVLPVHRCAVGWRVVANSALASATHPTTVAG
jgi:hypothetical protein